MKVVDGPSDEAFRDDRIARPLFVPLLGLAIPRVSGLMAGLPPGEVLNWGAVCISGPIG